MRNRGKHPRLKPVKGQIFTCGMFGTCSNSVLSPRTPPPLLLQEQHLKGTLSHPTTLPSKQDNVPLEKLQKSQSERQEKTTDSEVRSVSSERRFESVPSFTQWDFALEQEGRIKNRYLALIQRDLSPPQARVVPQEKPSPDVQTAESLCLETLTKEAFEKNPVTEVDWKNLRLLAANSEENRQYMLKAGVASNVVALLISSLCVRPDGCLTTSEEAMRLLVDLSDDESAKNTVLNQPVMLDLLAKLMSNGTLECKVNSLSLLLKLTSRDDLNALVGSSTGLMKALSKLLDRTQHARVTSSAIKVLLALCLCKENRSRAVQAAIVKALVEILPDLKAVNAERALAALELLCTIPEGRTALIKHALAIPLLVSLILRISDRGTEYAAGVLCAICAPDNVEAQEMALQVCAPTQLLLLLQSDCTDRARRKALKLLKALHTFCEESSCIPVADHINVSLK